MTKLDLKGLKCPLPVLKTRKALKALAADRVEKVFDVSTQPVGEAASRTWKRTCHRTPPERLMRRRIPGGALAIGATPQQSVQEFDLAGSKAHGRQYVWIREF